VVDVGIGVEIVVVVGVRAEVKSFFDLINTNKKLIHLTKKLR
jgi:hypothetical protein